MAMDTNADSALMDHILSITAPPSFVNKEGSGYSVEVKHGVKEPVGRWRSVNSQVCNCCGEGGDIICCDRCPASFHLLCLTPPIDESQLPPGKWLCNRCTRLPELDDSAAQTMQPGSGGATASHTPQCAAHVPPAHVGCAEAGGNVFAVGDGLAALVAAAGLLEGNKGSKPCSEASSGRSTPSACSAPSLAKAKRITADERSSSVGAASSQPAEQCVSLLDGRVALTPVITSKKPLLDRPQRRGSVGIEPTGAAAAAVAKRPLTALSEHERNALALRHSLGKHTTAAGLVDNFKALATAARALNTEEFALPAEFGFALCFPGEEKQEGAAKCSTAGGLSSRLCYVCRYSGDDSSALVECDYCPCSFHMDCLDPPLAAPPKYTWLCPNHVQHALDGKLLSTLSHSARADLWRARADGAFSEERVKLQFMHTAKGLVRRRQPHAKCVRRRALIGTVAVPEQIKSLYRAGAIRPADMPTLTEKALFLSAVSHFTSVRRRRDTADTWVQTDDDAAAASAAPAPLDRRADESMHVDSADQCDRGRKASKSESMGAGPSSTVNTSVESDTFVTDAEQPTGANMHCAIDRPLKKADKIEMIIARPDEPVLGALVLPYSGIALAIQDRVSTVGRSSACHCDLTRQSLSAAALATCRFVAPHHATIIFEPESAGGLGEFTWLSYAPYGCTVEGVRYGGLVPARSAAIGDCPAASPPRAGALAQRARRLVLTFDAHEAQSPGATSPPADTERPAAAAQCVCDLAPAPHSAFGAQASSYEGGVALAHGSKVQIGCCHMIFASPLAI